MWQGKGSLYIRPLLMGTGGILGLGPAPSYTFAIYCAAVGAYFKVRTQHTTYVLNPTQHAGRLAQIWRCLGFLRIVPPQVLGLDKAAPKQGTKAYHAETC